MNATEMQLLKEYMKPHYQDNEEILTVFLTKYGTASLSACRLWAVLAGKLSNEAEVKKISDGAESMEFTSAQQQYTNAMNQSKYYCNLYDSETGNNTSIMAPTSDVCLAGGIIANHCELI